QMRSLSLRGIACGAAAGLLRSRISTDERFRVISNDPATRYCKSFKMRTGAMTSFHLRVRESKSRTPNSWPRDRNARTTNGDTNCSFMLLKVSIFHDASAWRDGV